MKVLHVINNLGKGGAERLLVDALPKYKELGLEVSILQLSAKGSEAGHLKILAEHHIVCHDLNTSNLYSPVTLLLLRKFLSEHSYDVIHVHLFPALYWVSICTKLLSNRSKLVFTEHNTRNKRSDKKYLQFVEKWVYNQYDAIVAISANVEMALKERKIIKKRIVLINNGVDTDLFLRAQPYSADFLKEAFDLPADAFKIMMTARFRYPKDQVTLIDALKNLPENFVLLLTGDGEDRNKIEEYTQSQNLSARVRFLGFRPDIPQLMKSVDINVLSSAYEGMSGVTLEALAAGKPFLGSDVPGINDVVPDKSMLFEHKQSQKLANAIIEIAKLDTHSRTQLINKGFDQANRFSMDKMVKNYYNLYEEL